jgi:hypothetical protein
MRRAFKVFATITGAVLAAGASTRAQESYPVPAGATVEEVHGFLPLKGMRTFKVSVVDGTAILEGDIVLGPLRQLRAAPSIAIDGHRWPKSTLPYDIESGHPRRTDIQWAIQYVNANTNLLLVPRATMPTSHYVRFIDSGGCWSWVGRHPWSIDPAQPSHQPISIASGCARGSIVHEILHAAGLYHEQSREDRDGFVTINWSNIQSGMAHNFERRVAGASDIDQYCYRSLMHYSPTAFSANGQPTIVVKSPPALPGTQIGQRNGLDGCDIQAINRLYPPAPGKPQTPSGLWVGLSDGRSFSTSLWGAWSSGLPMRTLTGDFNGDGKTDVARADVPAQGTSPMGVWVSLSTGARFVTDQWATWDIGQSTRILGGDFDGDGKSDLMKVDIPDNGTSKNGLWVGLSRGNLFTTSKWAEWDTNRRLKFLTGDFNGDGKTDVMKIDVPDSGTSRNGLWVGLSDGTKFVTAQWTDWDTSERIKVLAGDFNGDGKSDVMKVDIPDRGTSRNGLWVGLSQSDRFPTSKWGDWDTNEKIRLLGGDFDGDGKTDVMKVDIPDNGTSRNGLWVGLSRDSKFPTGKWGDWDTNASIAVLSGDFNGDRKTDVMKVDIPDNGTSRNGLWVGISDGGQFPTSKWAEWDTSKRIQILTGDFNGDGKTDVMKIDL